MTKHSRLPDDGSGNDRQLSVCRRLSGLRAVLASDVKFTEFLFRILNELDLNFVEFLRCVQDWVPVMGLAFNRNLVSTHQ